MKKIIFSLFYLSFTSLLFGAAFQQRDREHLDERSPLIIPKEPLTVLQNNQNAEYEEYYALIPEHPDVERSIDKYMGSANFNALWGGSSPKLTDTEQQFIEAFNQNPAILMQLAARATNEGFREKSKFFESMWKIFQARQKSWWSR